MAESSYANILLVDDDADLTVMLSDYLRVEGFIVSAVHNGETAINDAVSGPYDAVILDIMLPKLSGIEVLRAIREKSNVPVIMLTAKGDNVDRVLGLELGADDYIAKPYFPQELVARLRAVLRRHRAGYDNTNKSVFSVADIHVNMDARKVHCANRELELTSSEFKLLVALIRAKEKILTKEELSQLVLGRPRAAYDRSLDVHVSNLRQKLADLQSSVVVETARGVGYRICMSSE